MLTGMFSFKDCRLARMSSGRYCLIRDLGLVKGGKGLKHHEVLIAFSLQAALQRIQAALLHNAASPGMSLRISGPFRRKVRS
jgi:hypothetical protein